MRNPAPSLFPGRLAPTELASARRLLHIAVQAVGNLGRTFLPPAADYSHISMQWDPQLRALVGERVMTPSIGVRAALCFEPPAILLLDDKSQVLNDWPLQGLGLLQLQADMRSALVVHRLPAVKFSVRPVNPMDMSVLGSGETFDFTPVATASELAAYYATSAALLSELAHRQLSGARPRVWPHHFDYSLLTPLGESAGEDSRSITLGMSPGDAYYDQPYFYATPWPYPKLESLPAVAPPAHWHRHEWTGVVLTARDFLAHSPEAETLAAFWRAAYGTLRELLPP
jgi:hypothetical protein